MEENGENNGESKVAPKNKRKRIGGRKPILNIASVAAAIAELSGNLAGVARRFNVDRNAVWKMVQKYPTLQQVVKDCREGIKDIAESALQRAIMQGEAWAICFFLKTQAKDRGYLERYEIDTGERKSIIIIEEVVASPARISDQDAHGAIGVSQ